MGIVKLVCVLMSVFITVPIWYFLLYRILSTVQANELMWFLYWVYVPISFFVAIIAALIRFYEK